LIQELHVTSISISPKAQVRVGIEFARTMCLSHSLLLGYVIQKNQWGSKDVLKQEAVKKLCVESACEYIYTVGVFDWLSRISRFLRESQGWLRLV